MEFKKPRIPRKITDLLLRLPSTPTLPCRTPISGQVNPQFPPDSNLKALCIKGRLKEALLEMTIKGAAVKFHGYDSLLTECINQRAIRDGQRVQAHMIKTCYLPPLYLNTRLIVLYVKCDSLEDARRVFDAMCERNVVSWTAVISAYAQKGHGSEALNLFVQMLGAGIPPNEFTFATILTACTGSVGIEYGRQVHSHVIKSNFESHIFVGSSLLDMYAKAGRIHEARGIFDKLPERDVVSCTAIIAGYAQLGFDEEALELFHQLHKGGMRSNYVTYASILTALSGLASLDYGQQVHNRIIRLELPSYVVLQNSLIDMYSKCGCLTYARQVFDNMSDRTVISWNAMLVGYGKHGLGKQVLELFELMRVGEVKPDNITFMAVLSGCSHGGLVKEGLETFDMMASGQDVEPEIEHYGCVVDLLGRAGQVNEAFAFIKRMPLKPTAAIWGSLLGACRVHANVPVGEYVAQRLFMIEPQNAGNYVILSNIYAAAGRWEDVMNVRKLMEEKTVMKEPGQSRIKLEKIMHTFHAGGRSHPKREEILAKIRELTVKIKEVGYVPDLSCVLHDVDDEQKERILLGHSEKFAMAFGLMETPEGLPIRVVKNLRICVDCHNFAKFISQVCGRELSLRDSNRFHHVSGGACSCGDYW